MCFSATWALVAAHYPLRQEAQCVCVCVFEGFFLLFFFDTVEHLRKRIMATWRSRWKAEINLTSQTPQFCETQSYLFFWNHHICKFSLLFSVWLYGSSVFWKERLVSLKSELFSQNFLKVVALCVCVCGFSDLFFSFSLPSVISIMWHQQCLLTGPVLVCDVIQRQTHVLIYIIWEINEPHEIVRSSQLTLVRMDWLDIKAHMRRTAHVRQCPAIS